MTIRVAGKLWYWKGPAPHYFVWVSEADSVEIKSVERLVTYGWGMIPAVVRLGESEYKTALWPKDGRYIVPIRAAVRKAQALEEGDEVEVEVRIGVDE